MSEAEAISAAPSPTEAKPASQLEFHFVRSSAFRVICADGAWFAPDATGTIHITFFNEHGPVPDKVVVNVDEQGTFIDEAERVTKAGVIRELEVDVVMSFIHAAQFHTTLGQNLKSMQEIINQTIPEEAKEIMKKALKR